MKFNKFFVFLMCLSLIATSSSCLQPNSKRTDAAGMDEEINCQWPANEDSLGYNTALSGGCGNITLYHILDSSDLVVISIDTNLVKAGHDCKPYPIDPLSKGITIHLYRYNHKSHYAHMPVCSDLDITNTETPVVVTNSGNGRLTIAKSPHLSDLTYYCSLKVYDLKFMDQPHGVSVNIDSLFFKKVRVGWSAG